MTPEDHVSEALRAALESREAQLTRQNAGLVQMARERDAAIAERDALGRRVRDVDAHAAIAHRSALEVVAHRIGLALDSPTEQTICHALHLVRSADHDPKLDAGRGFVQYVEALRAERDALRSELAETTDERNAAWRAIHEILSKCVEGLGDSASVIVESVAVNLLRDEVKRLKEKA